MRHSGLQGLSTPPPAVARNMRKHMKIYAKRTYRLGFKVPSFDETTDLSNILPKIEIDPTKVN